MRDDPNIATLALSQNDPFGLDVKVESRMRGRWSMGNPLILPVGNRSDQRGVAQGDRRVARRWLMTDRFTPDAATSREVLVNASAAVLIARRWLSS